MRCTDNHLQSPSDPEHKAQVRPRLWQVSRGPHRSKNHTEETLDSTHENSERGPKHLLDNTQSLGARIILPSKHDLAANGSAHIIQACKEITCRPDDGPWTGLGLLLVLPPHVFCRTHDEPQLNIPNLSILSSTSGLSVGLKKLVQILHASDIMQVAIQAWPLFHNLANTHNQVKKDLQGLVAGLLVLHTTRALVLQTWVDLKDLAGRQGQLKLGRIFARLQLQCEVPLGDARRPTTEVSISTANWFRIPTWQCQGMRVPGCWSGSYYPQMSSLQSKAGEPSDSGMVFIVGELYVVHLPVSSPLG